MYMYEKYVHMCIYSHIYVYVYIDVFAVESLSVCFFMAAFDRKHLHVHRLI